jgi:hypothetical protein
VPVVSDLPAHLTNDGSGTARAIADRFGIALDDVLGARY